jgi:NADH:ubiquinone oxidoreductase subunit E
MVRPPLNTAAPLPVEANGGVAADALIEVLHRLQERQGWLDRDSLRQVARQLRLPLSHVVGVASFYHLFLLEQPTPRRCAVCLGSACFVRGALELAQALSERLGVELDDPRGDGSWSLQRVGCLGACGQAPVLVVDERLLTRLPLAPDARPQLQQRLDEAGLPQAGDGGGRTSAGPATPQPMQQP